MMCIVVSHDSSGFWARREDDKDLIPRVGWGTSKAAAIGSLLLQFREELGLQIAWA